jgi:hypothetical protein
MSLRKPQCRRTSRTQPFVCKFTDNSVVCHGHCLGDSDGKQNVFASVSGVGVRCDREKVSLSSRTSTTKTGSCSPTKPPTTGLPRRRVAPEQIWPVRPSVVSSLRSVRRCLLIGLRFVDVAIITTQIATAGSHLMLGCSWQALRLLSLPFDQTAPLSRERGGVKLCTCRWHLPSYCAARHRGVLDGARPELGW